MARPKDSDNRFDFRGGVNLTHTDDTLSASELRRARNGRTDLSAGISKRLGSKRLHTVALGGPVLGSFQWDAPGGRQLVAIAGGTLWYRNGTAGEFTAGPSGFSTTRAPSFATHRQGSDIVLFIADGALRRWTGLALTGVPGAPAAVWICTYKNRLFALDGSKRLYWSALFNPLDWTVSESLGGFADVENYDTEPLAGAIRCGDSLVLFKADNVSRYTGSRPESVNIDTGTEGISDEVGLAAPGTLVGFEHSYFFVADEGPHVGDDAAIQDVGGKLAGLWKRVNRAALSTAVAAHAQDRKEVWLALPVDGSAAPNEVWAFNYRLGAWYGPWDMAGASLAEYTRADGTETVLRGGTDGFLREEDTGVRDDVLAAGTGGLLIAWEVDLPPLLFGDPARTKHLKGKVQNIAAAVGADGSLEVAWSTEKGTGGVTLPGRGGGTQDYLFKINAKGRRVQITLREATAAAVEVAGVSFAAGIGGTP